VAETRPAKCATCEESGPPFRTFEAAADASASRMQSLCRLFWGIYMFFEYFVSLLVSLSLCVSPSLAVCATASRADCQQTPVCEVAR
jgi:hypothetical protein